MGSIAVSLHFDFCCNNCHASLAYDKNRKQKKMANRIFILLLYGNSMGHLMADLTSVNLDRGGEGLFSGTGGGGDAPLAG